MTLMQREQARYGSIIRSAESESSDAEALSTFVVACCCPPGRIIVIV